MAPANRTGGHLCNPNLSGAFTAPSSKAQVLSECRQPGVSVSLKHGLNVNLVHK